MKVTPEETRLAVKELDHSIREARKNIVLMCQHRVLQRDRIVNSTTVYSCDDCKGTITTEYSLSLDQVIKKMEDSYARF